MGARASPPAGSAADMYRSAEESRLYGRSRPDGSLHRQRTFSDIMKSKTFGLTVTSTNAVCPVGEMAGRENAAAGAIPVLSCEGPCIRGEIARLAAHRLAKESGYRRACHGELLTAPHSTMAAWVKQAPAVVVIDGCHMKCHARVLEHLVPKARVRAFDAVGHYRRYADLFEIDSVPEGERKAVADDVAAWVRGKLATPGADQHEAASGGGAAKPCCGN